MLCKNILFLSKFSFIHKPYIRHDYIVKTLIQFIWTHFTIYISSLFYMLFSLFFPFLCPLFSKNYTFKCWLQAHLHHVNGHTSHQPVLAGLPFGLQSPSVPSLRISSGHAKTLHTFLHTVPPSLSLMFPTFSFVILHHLTRFSTCHHDRHLSVFISLWTITMET